MLNCVRKFVKISVLFHPLYLWNEVGDPHFFFFFAFLTQVTHYPTAVKIKKESINWKIFARTSSRHCPHYAGEIWKRIKYFPSTLRRRNWKTQQSPVIRDLCLRKSLAGKSYEHREVIVFEKLHFQHIFRPHGVLKFLRFEERFRKVPLTWQVSVDGRPSRGNKAAFSNFSVVVWTGSKLPNSCGLTQTLSCGRSRSGSTSVSLPRHSATTFLVPSSVLSQWLNNKVLDEKAKFVIKDEPLFF